MYMVSRWFAPDVEARTAPVKAAHQQHVGRYSNTVGSVRLIDEASGKAVGILAYSRIEIQKVEVYVWDGYFARTSKWYLDKHPEHADRFTPKQPYTRRTTG
jgi:hypothetical protein